jgi:lysozyme
LDAINDRYTKGNPARVGQIFGIDISGYEPNVPYDRLKPASVSFVIMKASQGLSCKDKYFDAHWAGMKALKGDLAIPFSAYHFLSSTSGESGAAQAEQFVGNVNAVGGFDIGGLRPAVDLEWDFQGGKVDLWTKRTRQEIIATIHDFISDVRQRTGWTPMIYTNIVFLRGHGITSKQDIDELRAGAKIWNFDLTQKDLALQQPTEDEMLEPVLWQFNWQMKLNTGYSGGDVNLFAGTQPEFKTELMTKN